MTRPPFPPGKVPGFNKPEGVNPNTAPGAPGAAARAVAQGSSELRAESKDAGDNAGRRAAGPAKATVPGSAQPMTDQAFVVGSTADSAAHKAKHKLNKARPVRARQPREPVEGGAPMAAEEAADHEKHR